VLRTGGGFANTRDFAITQNSVALSHPDLYNGWSISPGNGRRPQVTGDLEAAHAQLGPAEVSYVS
jgi:hypothetical protein